MSTASKIPDLMSRQFDLFSGVPTEEPMTELKTALQSGRRFVMGDPSKIFVGTVPLEDYLRSSGERAAFTVARLLDEQDWQRFEQRYAATGRAPYAPRGMMGLILYGLMQGVHSLRALERLARLDLGCMWVCGGITPDHANIGRFILLHETSLTSDFFESLTRSVLRASGSKGRRLAGDGTVIEAACSHYKLLKEDALKAHVDAARDALRQIMEHPKAQRVFRQRKAMVEPVFAHLRCQQKLERFRRRGLAAVQREFALHALAYNLSRAVRRLNALLIVLFNLLGHIYPVQNVLHRVTACSAWKGRMLGVAF